MTKKQIGLTLGFIILIAGVGFILRRQEGSAGAPGPRPDGARSGVSAQTHAVEHNDQGFAPRELTIRRGDSVTFTSTVKNLQMWPASDPHPVHTNYPEFDSKKAIGPGESYTFTFDRSGAWQYHDHLDPQHAGVIIVTE